jgi:toxin ParE1/3/4
MAFKLIWSPSARLDARDIGAFIAEDNPLAAARWMQSLFQVVQRLAVFPESGRMVAEFNDPAMREIILKRCRTVYRGDDEKTW